MSERNKTIEQIQNALMNLEVKTTAATISNIVNALEQTKDEDKEDKKK